MPARIGPDAAPVFVLPPLFSTQSSQSGARSTQSEISRGRLTLRQLCRSSIRLISCRRRQELKASSQGLPVGIVLLCALCAPLCAFCVETRTVPHRLRRRFPSEDIHPLR